MFSTPGCQGSILVCRVGNVIGGERAVGVALPFGVPSEANWFRRIIFGRGEGRQFPIVNLPPNVSGFDRAVAVGTKQGSVEVGVLCPVQ